MISMNLHTLTLPDFKQLVFNVYTQTHRDAGSAFESLLEALEACGPPGSVCGPVEVVVQRIYFYSVAQFPHTSLLRHRPIGKRLCAAQYVSRYAIS